jgi:hypothetical protein
MIAATGDAQLKGKGVKIPNAPRLRTNSISAGVSAPGYKVVEAVVPTACAFDSVVDTTTATTTASSTLG